MEKVEREILYIQSVYSSQQQHRQQQQKQYYREEQRKQEEEEEEEEEEVEEAQQLFLPSALLLPHRPLYSISNQRIGQHLYR